MKVARLSSRSDKILHPRKTSQVARRLYPSASSIFVRVPFRSRALQGLGGSFLAASRTVSRFLTSYYALRVGAEDGKTADAIVVLRDMWTHASPLTPTPPLADLGRPWPLFPVRPTDQELPDPTFSATRALCRLVKSRGLLLTTFPPSTSHSSSLRPSHLLLLDTPAHAPAVSLPSPLFSDSFSQPSALRLPYRTHIPQY